MRVTVLILALVTCFFLFLQAAIVNGFSQTGSADNTAAAFGVLMSLFLLISAAIVIPIPRVAMVLLALTGAIGIIAGTTSDFTDLIGWGIWGFLLALLSYFGYRGKRKQQRKEDAREQMARDALAANQQMATHVAYLQQQVAQRSPDAVIESVPVAQVVSSSSPTCSKCGTEVSPTAFFCPACGNQLRS